MHRDELPPPPGPGWPIVGNDPTNGRPAVAAGPSLLLIERRCRERPLWTRLTCRRTIIVVDVGPPTPSRRLALTFHSSSGF